tara:strand:+ start:71 stop:640 length:570 start_codon:yes stop_codon:yes gene_type:complete
MFKQAFQKSIETKQKCLQQGFTNLETMGEAISVSIKAGGKLMICGNGGSAADAQHLVAELLIRLRPKVDRAPLAAMTLAQDTSTITACANDYSFDQLFARNLKAFARSGDCLLGISTSGNSENVRRALEEAKTLNVKSFSFLGSGGGACLGVSELSFVVPSDDTASIQEAHIVAGHALMQYIEEKVCGV